MTKQQRPPSTTRSWGSKQNTSEQKGKFSINCILFISHHQTPAGESSGGTHEARRKEVDHATPGTEMRRLTISEWVTPGDSWTERHRSEMLRGNLSLPCAPDGVVL